jgi:hypothetical protein
MAMTPGFANRPNNNSPGRRLRPGCGVPIAAARLEYPRDFAGVAAIFVSVPVKENLVMIVNGTADPINPFRQR